MKSGKTGLRQAGVTFIELVVAIAVMGILIATALPSFKSSIESSRARGAADSVFADLHYAKSEAIKRNAAVRLVGTEGSVWSYCITTATACGTAADLKSASVADFSGTTMTVNAADNTISFSAPRGNANASSVEVSSGATTSKVIVSNMGRIRQQ